MRKALYILGDLDDHDLVWLADRGEVVALKAGEHLIHAGEPVKHLYFVTDGELAVELPDGPQLARIGVGDVIGEMSFVEKQPPNASVRATAPCRLLRIPRDVLLAEFKHNAAFAARFYRALAVFLSDRLRTSSSPDDTELDEGLLDTLHVAGDRMRRLIDVLEGRIRS